MNHDPLFILRSDAWCGTFVVTTKLHVSAQQLAGKLLVRARSLTIHQLISSLETVAHSVSISLAHEQFLNKIAHAAADSARVYFLPKNNQIGEFRCDEDKLAKSRFSWYICLIMTTNQVKSTCAFIKIDWFFSGCESSNLGNTRAPKGFPPQKPSANGRVCESEKMHRRETRLDGSTFRDLGSPVTDLSSTEVKHRRFVRWDSTAGRSEFSDKQPSDAEAFSLNSGATCVCFHLKSKILFLF